MIHKGKRGEKMWISREEWRALLHAMSANEELAGPIRNFVEGRRLDVRTFAFGHEEPQRVEVTFYLSYREWCEVQKTPEWEKLKQTYLE